MRLKIYLSIICLIATRYLVTAQVWTPVGRPGFTSGVAYSTSIDVDKKGNIFVVYVDDNNKAVVQKFDGRQWRKIGNTNGMTGPANIKLGADEIPYIVYPDLDHETKATVANCSTAAFRCVGEQGFSPEIANLPSIVIDEHNTIYIAYYPGVGNNRVMKYDGKNWVDLGCPGGIGNSLAIGKDNTLFVGQINVTSYKANVFKYSGGKWEALGKPDFSTGSVSDLSITTDREGTLYALYSDHSTGRRAATVMKYNNGSWVPVGRPGFSEGGVERGSIAVSSSGIPYVLFKNVFNDRATVMKYNGTNWVYVGKKFCSQGKIDTPFLVLDKNGVPFIAFMDHTQNGKATVMTIDEKTSLDKRK